MLRIVVIKNFLWISKTQALFIIPAKLHYPIFLYGQCDCLEGNLASVIKVTVTPSIAIHWLVF